MDRDLAIVKSVTTDTTGAVATEFYAYGSDRIAKINPKSASSDTAITGVEATFFLYDHLGNNRVAFSLDSSNTVVIVNAMDYFPYGKILREFNNGDGNRFLTTQHERDKETGLDYRGARYYDSDVARFLSLDPLAAKYPAWSAYNYVMGNPIGFTDANGKSPSPVNPSIEEIYYYCQVLERQGGIDHRVMFLILFKESSLKHYTSDGNVLNHDGDLGIAQITPYWHTHSIAGTAIDKDKLTSDWKYNVQIGSKIYYEELAFLVKRGYKLSGMQFYQKAYQMYNGGRDTRNNTSGTAYENGLTLVTTALTGLIAHLGNEIQNIQADMDNINNQILQILGNEGLNRSQKAVQVAQLSSQLNELSDRQHRILNIQTDMQNLQNEWNENQ